DARNAQQSDRRIGDILGSGGVGETHCARAYPEIVDAACSLDEQLIVNRSRANDMCRSRTRTLERDVIRVRDATTLGNHDAAVAQDVERVFTRPADELIESGDVRDEELIEPTSSEERCVAAP